MSSALIPGSFDPITLGHADIIRRAAKLFDEVTVCVFVNTEKQTMFTPQQRMEMAALAVRDIPNCLADFSSMTVGEYFEKGGYTAIVKGLRGAADIEYEMMIADVNRRISSGAETLYLPSEAAYSRISSTVARDMIKYRMPLEDWVPAAVAEYIRSAPQWTGA